MKQYIALSLAVVAFQTFNLRAQTDGSRLVVHEWGTFTSLQDSGGTLIKWHPFQTAELPRFVHDWQHPALPLRSFPALFYGVKGAQISYQRLETPVIYFYSEQEQQVDVTVKFPQGLITEWYPQASGIGPSDLDTNKEPGLTGDHGQTKESLIRWSGVDVMPAKMYAPIGDSLPVDTVGKHYFAARETDSEFLRVAARLDSAPMGKIPISMAAVTSCGPLPVQANVPKPEFEKCLFYRGVGNFATPLTASMKSDDAVTVANTGKEALKDLFVLTIKSGAGRIVHIPELPPGDKQTVGLNAKTAPLDAPHLLEQITTEMSKALVRNGLYQREADAMVKTWRDSWFAEDGVRVLYVLPQTWTEKTLPMTLNPKPRELVRVMVGRAEVLAPGMEKALTMDLRKATHGDSAASDEARAELKKLGRFAEPALNQALVAANLKPEEQVQAYALLNAAHAAN